MNEKSEADPFCTGILAPTSPRFSVIVPCYNYGRYLRQAVISVLSQTAVDIRVLILDDASSDESGEVASALVAQDRRVELVRHKVNRGHIATYNEGLEWANGDFFMLLSADDLLLPGAFGRAAALYAACPEVVLTYGYCLDVGDDASVELQAPASPPRLDWTVFPGQDFLARSGHRNLVPTPTAIVRTEVQRIVGPYRQELPHCGDMEMWWRFAAHGAVGFIHDYQAVKRTHRLNMAHQYYSSWLPDLEQREKAIAIFYHDYSSQVIDSPGLKAQAEQSLARMALHCARSALLQSKVQSFDQIMDFARRIDPQVAASRGWQWLVWLRGIRAPIWPLVARAVAVSRSRMPWLVKLVSNQRFAAFD